LKQGGDVSIGDLYRLTVEQELSQAGLDLM
jgi:hypothetical protein